MVSDTGPRVQRGLFHFMAEQRTFPLPARPGQSYHVSPRSFGSARDGGKRKHAGCDLYAAPGTAVLAVADGTVKRAIYPFYDVVFALEIDHPGVGTVRYGEIATTPVGLKVGDAVKAGQVIGTVGKMVSVKQAMLHFELYAGTGQGQLTDRARAPYMRRADLLDPTSFLDGCAVKEVTA